MTKKLPAPALGDELGHFTCIGAPVSTAKGRMLPVRCKCGKEGLYKLSRLTAGRTVSCGCAKTERFTAFATKHGFRFLPEYQLWLAMRQRCMNPRQRQYKDYGGRGIKVHPRWDSFENFYADMGPRPFEGAILDRQHNDGDYKPGNVVWSTAKESGRNKRDTLRFLFKGKQRTIGEIADLTGRKYKQVYWELRGSKLKEVA